MESGLTAARLFYRRQSTDACNDIATWRKNVCLVPCGKTGRDFIDQVASHICNWNNIVLTANT